MPTGRGSARRGTEHGAGARQDAATVPPCLRRIVLTTSLDDERAGVTGRFLESQGVSVVMLDTSAEDPFVDVDGLLPDIDLSTADAVITIGAPSATALAIALLCDLPFTMAGVIDGRRLAAIDHALQTGSAMHRSVLDVEIDAVRRLSSTDLEVIGGATVTARATDPAGERLVESKTIRIGSERPHSGRLFVDHADGPILSPESFRIDNAPPATRISINGREQQFRRLAVRVHGTPLRELVLGSQRQRRAVLDDPHL